MAVSPKGGGGGTPTTGGPYQSIAGNYTRFKKYPLDPAFDFEEALQFIATHTITDKQGKKGVPAQAVFVVDPSQAGNTPLQTATILKTGAAVVAGTVTAEIGTFTAREHMTPGATVATEASQGMARDRGSSQVRKVGTANTDLVTILDTLNMHSTLSIYMTAAGGVGTAPLLVEASADNSNYITLDTVAAAAATAKQYDITHLGAAIALNPLSFRYVRITAQAGGASVVATISIGCK